MPNTTQAAVPVDQGSKVKKTQTPLKAPSEVVLTVFTYLCWLVVVLTFGGNCIEGPWQEYTVAMTTINYPLANGKYGAGDKDNFSFAFFAVVLVCIRHLLCLFVFNPISDAVWAKESAGKPLGAKQLINKLIKRGKFQRNGWQFVYYASAWTWGFMEYYHSDYWLDMEKMWDQYPHNEHTLTFKLYYLFQGAFWIQMIVVTMLDVWQKDHIQMMTHHVLTTGLIVTSYNMSFVRVGHAILVEQDFADIFLPLAKMVRYGNLQPFDDVVFAIFAVVWIPTRHGIYFWIVGSIYNDAMRICQEQGTCGYDPSQGKYITEKAISIYFYVLCAFQCILLIWLKDLLIAVYGALRGEELKDAHLVEEDVAAAKPKAE